ncbi:hypothetical protein C772_02500 [Bhargavaea cecembensis DSE10]|uniref:Uncharacterized protein n=1 Tax=Bhargavaea cecembensis DSE10 TaxID=1235279 RepID=M7NAA6_9BACL|nr:hypothetical protein C772_02500 [Bhargavaea cecembensis DSE10]
MLFAFRHRINFMRDWIYKIRNEFTMIKARYNTKKYKNNGKY